MSVIIRGLDLRLFILRCLVDIHIDNIKYIGKCEFRAQTENRCLQVMYMKWDDLPIMWDYIDLSVLIKYEEQSMLISYSFIMF